MNILTKVLLAFCIFALCAAAYFDGRKDEARKWKAKYEEMELRLQGTQRDVEQLQLHPLDVTIIDDGGAHLKVESTVIQPKEQK